MAWRGLPLRGSLLALLCGLGAAVALAQTSSFSPSIESGLGYTDNVEFVAEQGSADTVGILIAELPWIRTTRSGTLRLLYRPALLRYRELEVLDRTEHRLDVDLNSRIGQATLGLFAQGNLTQQQGDAFSLDDESLFLDRRADREVYRLRLSYERPVSARWRLATRVGGAALHFDSIDGLDEAGSNEDRTEITTSIELSRALDRTARVGLEYEYSHYELEVSGDETVNLLRVNYERALSRRTTLELGLGGFSSSAETVAGASRQDYSLEFTLRHARRAVALELVASHEPSSGGAGGGTATNSILGLVVQKREPDVWHWQVSLRFAHRDPTSTDDRRTSAALAATAERRLSRKVTLRLDTRYLDQLLDDPASTEQSVLGATVGVVWYPRGTPRIGRD